MSKSHPMPKTEPAFTLVLPTLFSCAQRSFGNSHHGLSAAGVHCARRQHTERPSSGHDAPTTLVHNVTTITLQNRYVFQTPKHMPVPLRRSSQQYTRLQYTHMYHPYVIKLHADATCMTILRACHRLAPMLQKCESCIAVSDQKILPKQLTEQLQLH